MPHPSFVLGAAVTLTLLASRAPGFTYTFEDVSHPNRVVHPIGYDGTSGTLDLSVGIDPSSANASDMVISTKNVVSTFNNLNPQNNNVNSAVLGFSEQDFESTLLHEMGHAIGLNHPNIGGNSEAVDTDLTASFQGDDGSYDIGSGADGVVGTADDQRGDDINRNWFRMSNNDPFTIAGSVDASTYSRDTADLPSGDSFSANAGRAVADELGYGMNSEAVMQQGAFFGEVQRELGYDDVAGLRFAQKGMDLMPGGGDDYTFDLSYAGLTTGADIVIDFDNNETGFAVTQLTAQPINNDLNHYAINDADIFFNDSFDWNFTTTIPEPGTAALLIGGAGGVLIRRRRRAT